MKLYGLIGDPLEHSRSKELFNQKFIREKLTDSSYEQFPLKSLDQLAQLISSRPELVGLNVTIPYKEKIIAYLDSLDEDASTIGAVNCIKIERTGRNPYLTGSNTDATGFEKSIKPLLHPYHKKALVLGTGGSAHAIGFTFKRLGIPFKNVSRHPKGKDQIGYNDLKAELMHEYQVIINCTPVGMYPHMNTAPALPYQHLGPQHLLFDLVYNPKETLFLKKGREAGAVTENGLKMLKIQAEKSWEIWNR